MTLPDYIDASNASQIGEEPHSLINGGATELIADMTAVASMRGFDVPARRPFFETLVQLTIGVLFVSISATVTELEGITAVFLLTDEDDFNALASADLVGSVDGPVYRLGARRPSHGVVAPYTGGEALFGADLTRYDVGHRYAGGAQILTMPAADGAPADSDLLLLVRANGTLAPVTQTSTPHPRRGTP